MRVDTSNDAAVAGPLPEPPGCGPAGATPAPDDAAARRAAKPRIALGEPHCPPCVEAKRRAEAEAEGR